MLYGIDQVQVFFIIIAIMFAKIGCLNKSVYTQVFFGMKNKYLLPLILFVFSFSLSAQIGGTHTWSFLNLPNSARLASLGGKMVAIQDDDLSLVSQNPALLSEGTSNQLCLNYTNFFTDIGYGSAFYAHSWKNIGNFAAGIQFINYGNFIEADPTGLITGNFTAAEYTMNLSFARSLDSNWTVGISLKPIYSNLENYQAFGLASDLGISWSTADRLFTASLVAHNIGTQFKGYYSGLREPLPFEVLAGISQKLQHAPFRLIATFQHLQKIDLSYLDPEKEENVDPVTGENIQENKISDLADLTMRHIILAAEFIPTRSFYIRLGYNYKLRKEMMIDLKPGMVGFSFGFGLRISKFHLSYGRSAWHLAGGTNLFSISTNLSDFGSRSHYSNESTP